MPIYKTRQCNAMQYNTTQQDTIQRNATQYSTIHYNATQYSTIQYNTAQYNSIHYNTIQAQCNTYVHTYIDIHIPEVIKPVFQPPAPTQVVRRAEVYKYFGTFNRTLLTMFEVPADHEVNT